MKITTYEQAAEYVLNLPKFTPDFTLDDTGRHLRKLGNPDGKLHIIHVAGTNGKGSVCAYMQSILESAGYQTAVFTSPHLVDVRERFVIRGRMVTKEDFLQTFLQVQDSLAEECSEGGKVYCPNFYEYLFFMAMLLFSKADVDYCILETGLGGRLDATNAVGKKDLAVITKISLDHVAVLGDTVEQIAGEKAGILKAGAPIVFADTQESVSNIFRNRARELEISAYCVSKNDYAFLEFHNKTIDFSLHTRYYGYVRLSLQSQAKYQMENAALAVRAIEILDGGRTISVENIIRGVHDCVWSGRMEEILPDVYVDGAHNADGINAFLETVAADNCSGKRMLLFGVMQDKDYPHMMASLLDSGLFEYLAVTRLRTGRSAALEDIRKLIENRKQSVSAYSLHDSVDTAWRELRKQQDPGDRIYIAGSLYLVGEIKELLEYD